MPLSDHQEFLHSVRVPLRLGLARDDQPIIVPLWFVYEGERLWCACHRSSYVVRRIREQTRDPMLGLVCAFDISTNDPPYRGIRGTGQVTLVEELGGEKLSRLTGRYLDDASSGFASWLLSRSDEEVALCISATDVKAWDFTARMSQ